MKRERKDPAVYVNGTLHIDKIPKDSWKMFLVVAEDIVQELYEKNRQDNAMKELKKDQQ